MTLTIPWALDSPSTDAQVARVAMGSLIGAAGGLDAAGALEVKQKGTPDMHVLIKGGTPAEGGAWVPGTFTTTQGPFHVYNNANFELAIPASDATNPRIETIVVRVYDNATDSSGKAEAEFEAVKGTATPGANLTNLTGVGAVPKSALVLAYVEVPAKATSILTANIKNVATQFAANGGQSAFATIATEQERSNAAYGLLATPDEVTLVVPEGGLIAITYKAQWNPSVSVESKAAIFIGANQLKAAKGSEAAPALVETASIHTGYRPLHSFVGGLTTYGATTDYTGDVTTGQLVGWISSGSLAPNEFFGGPCYVDVPAGTYKISVQFKTGGGSTVKVKSRKLVAWVV